MTRGAQSEPVTDTQKPTTSLSSLAAATAHASPPLKNRPGQRSSPLSLPGFISNIVIFKIICIFAVPIREVAQLASALRSGRRGRVFESPLPDIKRLDFTSSRFFVSVYVTLRQQLALRRANMRICISSEIPGRRLRLQRVRRYSVHPPFLRYKNA